MHCHKWSYQAKVRIQVLKCTLHPKHSKVTLTMHILQTFKIFKVQCVELLSLIPSLRQQNSGGCIMFPLTEAIKWEAKSLPWESFRHTVAVVSHACPEAWHKSRAHKSRGFLKLYSLTWHLEWERGKHVFPPLTSQYALLLTAQLEEENLEVIMLYSCYILLLSPGY